jgi:glycine cleavage system H lipoate-binding protein
VPVEAVITAVNDEAVEEPAKINEDAENCWIVKVDIKNSEGFSKLMDKDAYDAFVESS